MITEAERPNSMGRLSAFNGNVGVLLRAYVYARMLGREGMRRVAEFATLNANYLMAKLSEAGFDLAYPGRRAGHEFIVTMKKQKAELQVTALHFAKRLLDYGFHAPTVYFPIMVPECLLIEPTETENKETLDAFTRAMTRIMIEANDEASTLLNAPHETPVKRIDEARAARKPDLKLTQPIRP
jgi:glycine dehydrogenase subunit 2